MSANDFGKDAGEHRPSGSLAGRADMGPVPQGSSRTQRIGLPFLYIGLGIASALLWTRIADLASFPRWHAEMIGGRALAPSQYRPLTSWIAEVFRLMLRTSYIPLPYFIVRALFTSLALICFDRYMRTWFSAGASAAGALCLAAILPFTYFRVIQESDTLNLLIFVLGFWAIAARRDVLLIPIMLIGTLNRETTAMIPAIYFLARWRYVPTKRLLGWTAFLILCWVAVYGGLRVFYGDRGYYTDVVMLSRNLRNVLPTVNVLLMFGAVWVLAFFALRKAPPMLRRTIWLLPPFITLHYIVAIVTEVRLFLPFAPVLIPLAWWVLFPGEIREGTEVETRGAGG
jgi:hypothetical protein